MRAAFRKVLNCSKLVKDGVSVKVGYLGKDVLHAEPVQLIKSDNFS